MSKQNKPYAFPIVTLLFICGGIGYLAFTGQLPHVIDKIRGTQETTDTAAATPAEAEEVAKEVVEKPVAPVIEEPVEPIVKETVEPVVKKAVAKKKSDVTESANNEMAEKYRARFKAPKPGQKMKIYLKGVDKPRIAILKQLDDKGIAIKTETYDMILTKDQLGPITRAQCYEDDYVKYMIARDARNKSIERQRAEQLAEKKKQYMEFMAKKGKLPSKPPSSSGKTEEASSISSDDASFFGIGFEEWLKEEGGSGSNNAR